MASPESECDPNDIFEFGKVVGAMKISLKRSIEVFELAVYDNESRREEAARLPNQIEEVRKIIRKLGNEYNWLSSAEKEKNSLKDLLGRLEDLALPYYKLPF